MTNEDKKLYASLTIVAVSAISFVMCTRKSKKDTEAREKRTEELLKEDHEKFVINADALIAYLDKRIEAGKFWLQVLGPFEE